MNEGGSTNKRRCREKKVTSNVSHMDPYVELHCDLRIKPKSTLNFYLKHISLFLFRFQNAKLTVIPVSTKISAQSVKVDFTYTLESALTIAQKGWKPITIPWSASVLVRRSSKT